MYITNKTKNYPCTGYYPTANDVRFSVVAGLTLPISGMVKLCTEDGFILAEQDCGDYTRQSYADGVLTLTNEEEIVISQPTVAELAAVQIEALKAQLAASDYKVIKCSEYSLAGIESPYDIVDLNTVRQAIRDQINALEAET